MICKKEQFTRRFPIVLALAAAALTACGGTEGPIDQAVRVPEDDPRRPRPECLVVLSANSTALQLQRAVQTALENPRTWCRLEAEELAGTSLQLARIEQGDEAAQSVRLVFRLDSEANELRTSAAAAMRTR